MGAHFAGPCPSDGLFRQRHRNHLHPRARTIFFEALVADMARRKLRKLPHSLCFVRPGSLESDVRREDQDRCAVFNGLGVGARCGSCRFGAPRVHCPGRTQHAVHPREPMGRRLWPRRLNGRGARTHPAPLPAWRGRLDRLVSPPSAIHRRAPSPFRRDSTRPRNARPARARAVERYRPGAGKANPFVLFSQTRQAPSHRWPGFLSR